MPRRDVRAMTQHHRDTPVSAPPASRSSLPPQTDRSDGPGDTCLPPREPSFAVPKAVGIRTVRRMIALNEAPVARRGVRGATDQPAPRHRLVDRPKAALEANDKRVGDPRSLLTLVAFDLPSALVTLTRLLARQAAAQAGPVLCGMIDPYGEGAATSGAPSGTPGTRERVQ